MYPISSLSGLRILIVEDDALVALNLQDVVEGLGCTVVGPVGRLAQAMDLVAAEPLDGAMLDINLHGEMVYPLAERLTQREIPFLFCSGHAFSSAMPAKFAKFPQVAKPMVEHTLRAAMIETFGCNTVPPGFFRHREVRA